MLVGMTSDSPASTTTLAKGSPLVRDDWADDLPPTDHVRFFKSRDWAQGPLGPLEQWSAALRIHVFTLFADSRPSCLYWGPQRVAIYNEGFMPLAGKAHPMLMGATFEQGLPEIWDNIKGLFMLGEQTGVAADVFEIEMFIQRGGILEETYFTGNFNPLRGDSGMVEGFYNAVHEVTRQAIGDRRTAMLNLVSRPLHNPEKGYGEHIIAAFKTNPRDVPMALLYELDDKWDPGKKNTVRLIGRIGVPEDHKLAVKVSDVDGNDGFIPHFKRSTKEITSLKVNEDYDGFLWQGFGEPSKIVHILPLSGGGRLFGFLVLGMNARRGVDGSYLQYLQDLSRRLSSTMTSAISIAEAKQREERLEKDLAESERRIRYMAKHASVGMLHLTTDGSTLWANEQYYKLVGYSHSEESDHHHSFLQVVHDDDKYKALDAFNKLSQGEPLTEFDLRLTRTFSPPFGQPEPVCVLVYAFPYSETDHVESIMSCITDVSRLKWAEAWQARQAQDAREAKRRQEEFVDVISHEIRNPLSAIFQCADMISSSQTRFIRGDFSEDRFFEALANNVEDANTILMCAKHQKRMIDDILTLSKLDFIGLSISPAGIQLSALVEGAVKMFEVELASHDIDFQVVAEDSVSELQVDWILCDPSRVTQVLVNLLTNAIKFTRVEQTRKITITYGATLWEPRHSLPADLHWAPRQEGTVDMTRGWNPDDQFYLTVTVTDTGSGMTSEEIQRLFSRFEQGNSRTSIKYGGSGLGLYISRQLTTKHGGDIGVASVPGTGSRFVFYIRARRSNIEESPPAPRPSNPQQAIEKAVTIAHHKHKKSRSSGTNILFDPALSHAHILLVEDNIVNQRVLRKQLLNASCTVSVANHGVEALEFLQTTTFWHDPVVEAKRLDVVLMDVEMPTMNGLLCTREIRRLQGEGMIMGHVAVIGITANARQEQIDVALEAGMDEVITKPFVISDLLRRIKTYLQKGKAT